MRQVLASPPWSESNGLTEASEIFGSSSCCTEAAVRDVAWAQLQPSNAVLLRWEPPGPPGEHPSHTPPFTMGQKQPGTDTAKLRQHLHLLPAQRPAAKHSSPLRGHVRGEEVAARTIFPGLNAIQVCLGEIRRFLVWMLWGVSSTSLGCWGTLTALVPSCTTV